MIPPDYLHVVRVYDVPSRIARYAGPMLSLHPAMVVELLNRFATNADIPITDLVVLDLLGSHDALLGCALNDIRYYGALDGSFFHFHFSLPSSTVTMTVFVCVCVC